MKDPSFELDSFPVESELDRLWRAAWGAPLPAYPAGKPARQRFALRPEAEATPLDAAVDDEVTGLRRKTSA